MNIKNALKIFGAGTAVNAMLIAFLLLGGTEEQFEFLVRLEDKVNTQVFCLNPAHEGNHMDRVVYTDATFNALCPECSSDEYLYRKNNAITKKGHFITFKPEGWSWGTNERLHYGIVKITCTYEQAQALCKGIGNPEDLINYRPREHVFDFETVLTPEQLSNWKNKGKNSDIVMLSDLAEVE